MIAKEQSAGVNLVTQPVAGTKSRESGEIRFKENCPYCNVHRGHKANCPGARPSVNPADYTLEKYREFLRAKCNLPLELGVKIEPDELQTSFPSGFELKPHQAAAILWGVRGGRRALFESFGLGKTVQQLLILQLILKVAGGRGLIVAPLGVVVRSSTTTRWKRSTPIPRPPWSRIRFT